MTDQKLLTQTADVLEFVSQNQGGMLWDEIREKFPPSDSGEPDPVQVVLDNGYAIRFDRREEKPSQIAPIAPSPAGKWIAVLEQGYTYLRWLKWDGRLYNDRQA